MVESTEKSEAVICNARQPSNAPNLLTFPSCNVPVKAQSARISNYRKSPCVIMSFNRNMSHGCQQIKTISMMHLPSYPCPTSSIGLLSKPQSLEPDGFCNIHVTAYFFESQ